MKTMFVGDIHGKWSLYEKLINKTNPEIIIQVGDLGYFPNMKRCYGNSWEFNDIPKSVKTYFIDGNHEDISQLRQYKNLENPVEIIPNINYVPRGCVFTINETNILGIGGALSIDRDIRTPEYDWFYDEIIDESVLYLLEERCKNKRIHIIVSHTCPHILWKYLNKKNIYEFPDHIDHSMKILDEVFKTIKPDLWIFGHWHTNFECNIKNTKFICLNQITYKGDHIVLDI